MIRAFIAVALPDELKARLVEVSRRLKALGLAGSFPKPDSIHLTLKFLGDISEADIGSIGDGLEVVAKPIPRFDATVGGLGTFPNVTNPRVVWVGVEAGPWLTRLQSAVEKALEDEFPPEGRPFSPHLTLARLKSRDNVKALAAFMGEKAANESLGTFTVDAIHLFRSELRPDGARYTRLRSVRLAGVK